MEQKSIENKKHIICRKLHVLETCLGFINNNCIYAHTYTEFEPLECSFDKECKREFCRRYHKNLECKCKYLMRLGKCPPYFWNYHNTYCIKNELIQWICSEYKTPHSSFCDKLILVEKYHSAYKAVLALLIENDNIKDVNHAIQTVNQIITFAENLDKMLELYDIKQHDIFREFLLIHNVLKYK